MFKRSLTKSFVRSMLGWLFLIFLWEICSRIGIVNQIILPPFSQVLVDLTQSLIEKKLLIMILNSLRMVCLGFGISLIFSNFALLCCHKSKAFIDILSSFCTVFNAIPSVALLPLIIMWFGVRSVAIIVVIIHGVFWTLLRHLIDGIKTIQPTYLEWGYNIEMTSMQFFFYITIYSLIPAYICGMRIAWGRAWRAVVSAEMIFGIVRNGGGIGFYINQSRTYGSISDVIGGVILIVLINLFVEYVIFNNLERCTIQKWGNR